MSIIDLTVNNLATFPLLCFFTGILIAWIRPKRLIPPLLSQGLALALLLLVGLKGGPSLFDHFTSGAGLLFGILALCGFLQPFLAYLLLRRSTRLDKPTACAISASFGSISIMTFVAGTTFLENQQVEFQKMAIGAAALMEAPGILAGLFLARKMNQTKSVQNRSLLKETFLNRTIFFLFAGLCLGVAGSAFEWESSIQPILSGFKPLLCVFLFDMGQRVALFWNQGHKISWPVALFGIYMPLLGAMLGISISSLAGLERGTGTLIALLLASASYIAAPAAMRIAVPEARESVYLPLALGITFPFNVVVGIPLYYQLAARFLN